MVQWRHPKFVYGVRIKALIDKVDGGCRTVSLCSNMQHVYALVIAGIDVSSMFDKQPDHRYVAVKRSVVQGCEAICAPSR